MAGSESNSSFRPSNIARAPGITTLGAGNGGLLIANALHGGFDHTDPLSWINLVIGILTLVAGALYGPKAPPHVYRDMHHSGRAELSTLAALTILLGGLLLAVAVYAGPMVLTDNVTVTQTPVAMGTDTGRMRLLLEVETGQPDEGLRCGPMAVPSTKWPLLLPGDYWEIGIPTSGGSTAQTMVKCVAISATPVVVTMTEEGEMPGATATVTATATATATDTPVPPTATPTETPA